MRLAVRLAVRENQGCYDNFDSDNDNDNDSDNDNDNDATRIP